MQPRRGAQLLGRAGPLHVEAGDVPDLNGARVDAQTLAEGLEHSLLGAPDDRDQRIAPPGGARPHARRLLCGEKVLYECFGPRLDSLQVDPDGRR